VIELFRNDYGRDNYNDRGNSSPINEGEEYDVKIEDKVGMEMELPGLRVS